jgi:hypothetical protein
MADNIKIVGNILDITTVSRYSEEDINLIPSKNLTENFGGKNDYIEYYIYNIAGDLLGINYNYLNYKLPPSTGLTPGVSTPSNTTDNIQTENVGVVSTFAPQTSSLYPIIEIDPIQDLQNTGYSSGEFNVRYNLFQNILSNYTDQALFVKEISANRTEIRLASVSLTNDEIESVVTSMINKINNSDYYVDYLLNFGGNEQYIAVNVALNKSPEGYEVLFKLYKSLPLNIVEKQTLWVIEEKVNPYIFDINLDKLVTPPPAPTLRGPNFGIEIPNHSTISTQYANYSTLVTGLQSLQSSSYNQILNLLATQSINISVDYTDFDNFIFFGSANQRVTNFYTKIKQIEDYNTLISNYTPLLPTTPSLITEINKYSSSVNTIISQFDGYESYLYFESSSYAWPKSGSLKPYQLLSTTFPSSSNWYNNTLDTAEYFDKNNPNNLVYSIPVFIKEDDNNAPFLLFLNMVGHYFDNIWIYLKAITDVNLANNNLNAGISKDLVYDQLKSLGLHLYNSQAGEDVDKFLIGANTGSSTWNNNTTITGSYLNNIPRKDLVAELYKRIYHNLPLLLKQKGTVEGLDNLISIFGIPSRTYYVSGSETFYTPTGSNYTASLLNVKEYGGSTKAGLVKGYNTDKVRIVANTIEGSVLSPLRSLQTFPTNPSDFRDGDMHYIDISFSPQTQIDTYASKSISSNNPTWSLDDFIGDPRQQYSGLYSDLADQRKLYYQTGVAGYPGFTGSLMDYNGFIRLIQYFDNSLFKMLEDFVPERASLSTGVTINSPVLERNKAVYANPTNSTTQSVYEAEYSASTITGQYGHFYDALQNDKKPFFDGVLSGSTVDVHQYFIDNYNDYLLGDNEYTCSCFTYSAKLVSAQSDPDVAYYDCDNNFIQSTFSPGVKYYINMPYNYNFQGDATITRLDCSRVILKDQAAFEHTDWNVLLNNVSSSVLSSLRQEIEYLGDLTPTNSITYPAELQDSYLTLRTHNNSRYDGSKTVSKYYNTYQTSSFVGPDGITILNGDYSYGRTAAIDKNVRKIGIFTQIVTSSVLPNRSYTALKYLTDELGNLTELNQFNNNWMDIQRIFVMGDISNVSQFDTQKYSVQTFLDGNKKIWDSGYKYAPILYGGGIPKKVNRSQPSPDCTPFPYLYFDTLDEKPTYISKGILNNTSFYIKGGPPPDGNLYPLLPGTNGIGFVGNLFNDLEPLEPGVIQYLQTGSVAGGAAVPPTYTVPESGDYSFEAGCEIEVTFPPSAFAAGGTLTWEFYLTKNSTTTPYTPPVLPLGDEPAQKQLFTMLKTSNFNPISSPSWYVSSANTALALSPVSTVRSVNPISFPGVTPPYPIGSEFYKYSFGGGFWEGFDANTCTFTGQNYKELYRPKYTPAGVLNTPTIPSAGGGTCGLGSTIPNRSFTNSQPNLCYLPYFNIDRSKPYTIKKQFGSNFKSRLNSGDIVRLYSECVTNTLSDKNNYTASFINTEPQYTNFTAKSLSSLPGKYFYTYQNFCSTTQSYEQAFFCPPDFIPDPLNDRTWDPTHELVLGSDLTSFYGPNFQFLPNPGIRNSSASSNDSPYYSGSAAYYGDIDVPFQLEPYDIFAYYDEVGFYFESRILAVEKRSGSLVNGPIKKYLVITLEKEIPSDAQIKLSDLGYGNHYGTGTTNPYPTPTVYNQYFRIKFIFIKRIKDETQVILNYRKHDGQTSFGLLIPNNLAPDVSANINNITRQIKEKVQTDQPTINNQP